MTSPRSRQRLVDVLRLPQAVPSAPDLPTRRTGQVHQVQLPCGEAAGRSGPPQERLGGGARAGRWGSWLTRGAGEAGAAVTPRTVTMSRACDAELCSFRLVNSVVRLVWPNSEHLEREGRRTGFGVGPPESPVLGTPMRGVTRYLLRGRKQAPRGLRTQQDEWSSTSPGGAALLWVEASQPWPASSSTLLMSLHALHLELGQPRHI